MPATQESSAPDPVERTDLQESDTGETQEGKKAVTPALGRLAVGDNAREAAYARWSVAQKTSTSPAEGLQKAADAQLAIATGPKSIPASARTAAARAYADLVVAAEAARSREGAHTDAIAWDTMTPARMTLLRTVLDAEEEAVEAWLAHVAREGEERAGARTEGEAEG